MHPQLARHTTPFTIGLFLISTLSGLALFFHLAPAVFHGMHEWLSLLLLIPVGLHLARNWPAMVGYWRRRGLVGPLVLSLLAAMAFAGPALLSNGGRGLSPQTLVKLMTSAPLRDLAPLLTTTPEILTARLTAQGYGEVGHDSTLETLARRRGESPREVLGKIIQP